MKMYLKSIALVATVLISCPSIAQTAASTSAGVSVDPCRIEVSKFERALGFVCESQGTAAAADVKEKLLPAKLESDILSKEGYCGLAKHLRSKKLI
jgi:hypothetical protein